MGAAKKKKKAKKINKHFPWKDLETVEAALKKGQIPYVDFFPLKGAKKNDYIIVDPNKKIDLRANRQDTWNNLGNIAKQFYDTPAEAIEVLVKAANEKIGDESRYILCCHIECDWVEKENKHLSLNALIDKNLENYCMFIGVPYSDINPSVRKVQTVPDTAYDNSKPARQEIIDRIVEKHRRLVKKEPKKFKKWMRENAEIYRKD
jgi:hypothetical protein